MLAGYEKRKAEYETRIKEWITKGDLNAYEGLNLRDIRKILGNEKYPIAEVPVEAADFFGIEDVTVYSSEAYFIDHVVNHHGELSLDDYIGVVDTLSDFSDIYISLEYGDPRLIFSQKRDTGYRRASVGLDKETGSMVVYLSYFQPSKNIDEGRRKLEVSSVGGTPLSLPDRTSDALAISRQHDTSYNQTVSSEE